MTFDCGAVALRQYWEKHGPQMSTRVPIMNLRFILVSTPWFRIWKRTSEIKCCGVRTLRFETHRVCGCHQGHTKQTYVDSWWCPCCGNAGAYTTME